MPRKKKQKLCQYSLQQNTGRLVQAIANWKSEDVIFVEDCNKCSDNLDCTNKELLKSLSITGGNA